MIRERVRFDAAPLKAIGRETADGTTCVHHYGSNDGSGSLRRSFEGKPTLHVHVCRDWNHVVDVYLRDVCEKLLAEDARQKGASATASEHPVTDGRYR